MPGEENDTKTRVSLTEIEEGNISVKWKEGDQISLCFVSEDDNIVKTVSDVAMTNISENGKRFILSKCFFIGLFNKMYIIKEN